MSSNLKYNEIDGWLQTRQLTDTLWLIREPLGRMMPDYLTDWLNLFLILNPTQALLVDTGTGLSSIRKVVSKLVGPRRTTTVLTTHHHFDHVGCLHEFDQTLVHPAEIPPLLEPESLEYIREDMARHGDPAAPKLPTPYVRQPITQDMCLAVEPDEWMRFGEDEFQIVHLPGHTAGGLGLWNPQDRIFFVGDTFQLGYVYTGEDPRLFRQSLDKMASITKDGGGVFVPSHEKLFLTRKDLQELQDVLDQALDDQGSTSRLTNSVLDNRLFDGGKFKVLLPLLPEDQ